MSAPRHASSMSSVTSNDVPCGFACSRAKAIGSFMSFHSGGCASTTSRPKRGISVMRPCGHRHRLRVARRVRPRDGNLAALQVPAELLADRHQVGQGLERVVDVALHVEDRHRGVLGDLAHVAVALAGHEVVPDGDGVAVAREDDAHVLGRLAVGRLRGLGRDEVRVGAELRRAGLEGVARARGLVEEEQEDGLVRQVPRRTGRPGRLSSGRPRSSGAARSPCRSSLASRCSPSRARRRCSFGSRVGISGKCTPRPPPVAIHGPALPPARQVARRAGGELL